MAISSVRKNLDNAAVLQKLGLLGQLAGKWQGGGFNLVARPNFEDQANLFLELNLTSETLEFTPITSSIPNRGFFQPDIELFGLTYLQQISDATTGGALHIEPGIWVTQPETSEPFLAPPDGGQLVSRMGNIPHGNSLLAQGLAATFSGPPTISPGAQPISGGNPAFSNFPSFNSTPFAVTNPLQPIFAAQNSESQSKIGGGFSEYTLSNPASAANPRTPLGNAPPVLPPSITQELVNDPILLLQQTIQQQIADGYQFEGVALNIATVTSISFFTQPLLSPANPNPPTIVVSLPQFGGGIENISFLGQQPQPNVGTNADSALVYATFWIEKLTHPDHPPFMQLQYAQMVLLNFPARTIPGQPNFSWPHISVSTLRKALD
ncbi:MAG: heme-binding protein [Methylomonas sp.]|jgi:hypothetical protein